MAISDGGILPGASKGERAMALYLLAGCSMCAGSTTRGRLTYLLEESYNTESLPWSAESLLILQDSP